MLENISILSLAAKVTIAFFTSERLPSLLPILLTLPLYNSRSYIEYLDLKQ